MLYPLSYGGIMGRDSTSGPPASAASPDDFLEQNLPLLLLMLSAGAA
jgi:hypothetical protein